MPKKHLIFIKALATAFQGANAKWDMLLEGLEALLAAGLRLQRGEADQRIGIGMKFIIYQDPDPDVKERERFSAGTEAIEASGYTYETLVSEGDGVAAVIAGYDEVRLPRFFLGDPREKGWGPAQAKVNNGGLRWLLSHIANVRKLEQVLSAPAQIRKNPTCPG